MVQGPKEVGIRHPLHFAVHDAQGDCLVIEYVKGKLHTLDNPLGVTTNVPRLRLDDHLSKQFHQSLARQCAREEAGPALILKQFGQGSGLVGLPGDFTPPSRLVRMVALTQAALPVKGPEAGLNLAMTIINNVDVPKGAVRDKD